MLTLTQFETDDHLLLPGLLYEPAKKTDKVAVYLHGNGHGCSFYSIERNTIFAETLHNAGISFFSFNNRGAHLMHKLTRKIGEQETEVNVGTAYELIKDCIYDIDGLVIYLKSLGYSEIYLIGHSTGANKIVVYDYYKKNNEITKYILLAGGDDTGLYYKAMGKSKFFQALKRSQTEIEKGNGEKLVPKYFSVGLMSYQSLFDTINPEGDYNIFSFNEALNNLNLQKKELFKEYKQITKPTFVIYGELDEYCYNDVPACVELLQKATAGKHNFKYQIIPESDHGFHGHREELAKTIVTWITTSS